MASGWEWLGFFGLVERGHGEDFAGTVAAVKCGEILLRWFWVSVGLSVAGSAIEVLGFCVGSFAL
jgi:hypothetical protein